MIISFTPFVTQIGIQYWFLAGALHGVACRYGVEDAMSALGSLRPATSRTLGGMDRANHALARYLAMSRRRGPPRRAPRVADDLAALPGVHGAPRAAAVRRRICSARRCWRARRVAGGAPARAVDAIARRTAATRAGRADVGPLPARRATRRTSRRIVARRGCRRASGATLLLAREAAVVGGAPRDHLQQRRTACGRAPVLRRRRRRESGSSTTASIRSDFGAVTAESTARSARIALGIAADRRSRSSSARSAIGARGSTRCSTRGGRSCADAAWDVDLRSSGIGAERDGVGAARRRRRAGGPHAFPRLSLRRRHGARGRRRPGASRALRGVRPRRARGDLPRRCRRSSPPPPASPSGIPDPRATC